MFESYHLLLSDMTRLFLVIQGFWVLSVVGMVAINAAVAPIPMGWGVPALMLFNGSLSFFISKNWEFTMKSTMEEPNAE